MCTYSNHFYPDKQAISDISCDFLWHIDRRPRLVDTSPASYVAKVGETVRLRCKFLTWKSAWKMSWYVNDKVIRIKRKEKFRQRNGRSSLLRIKNVRKEDAGMYRCVTRNKFGSVSKQLNLTVIGKLLNKLQSNLILVFALLGPNFVKSTPMCRWAFLCMQFFSRWWLSVEN